MTFLLRAGVGFMGDLEEVFGEFFAVATFETRRLLLGEHNDNILCPGRSIWWWKKIVVGGNLQLCRNAKELDLNKG